MLFVVLALVRSHQVTELNFGYCDPVMDTKGKKLNTFSNVLLKTLSFSSYDLLLFAFKSKIIKVKFSILNNPNLRLTCTKSFYY